MFACATYPTFDDDFMATVELEASDNIRRLRHHACLALWCGNNELEQGLVSEEWTRDFDELERITAVSSTSCCPIWWRRYDPDTDYWPSSPHSAARQPL